MYKRVALLVASITCGFSSSAFAQSASCSDILKDGTFQTTQYQNSNYFQQIVYSRFLKSTYQQAKTDRGLGFGVPIGEVVLEGNFTEQQFSQKKTELQRTFYGSVDTGQETRLALMKGDEEVVRAWSSCMTARTGIAVSFRSRPNAPREAVLVIQWFPAAGVTSTRLTEDVYLGEGVEAVSGQSCLKAGAEIVATVPCRAVLRLPSAFASPTISVNTTNGSDDGFLPPRLKLKRERKPFVFPADARLPKSEGPGLGYSNPGTTVQLGASDMAQNWSFVPSSMKANLIIERAIAGGSCWENKQDGDLYSFSYSYRIRNGHNATTVCHVVPTAVLVRDRWVPDQIEDESAGTQ